MAGNGREIRKTKVSLGRQCVMDGLRKEFEGEGFYRYTVLGLQSVF